jgi:hypothetical protein
MSQPFSSPVPLQRGTTVDLPQTSLQQRVQFAALLQIAEHGKAHRSTTTAICPGTDRRDLESALEHLLDAGSIQGPTWRLDSLVTLAESGCLTLTPQGQLRLDGDNT